jgi:hypothetical protein
MTTPDGTAYQEPARHLQNFEVVGDHAEYRPGGEMSFHEAIGLVASGIEYARERQIKKLMVVTLGFSGLQPPNVFNRYYFIQEWAKASAFAVEVAVVTRPEIMDPERFGVTVAGNIGFVSNVFSSEEEALAWLRSV